MLGQNSDENKENHSPPVGSDDDIDDVENLFGIHERIQQHFGGARRLTRSKVRKLAKKLDGFELSSPNEENSRATAYNILSNVYNELEREEKTRDALKSPGKRMLLVKRSSLTPYTVPSPALRNNKVVQFARHRRGSETPETASEGNLYLATLSVSSEHVQFNDPFMNDPGSYQNREFVPSLQLHDERMRMSSETETIVELSTGSVLPYASENSTSLSYLAISNYEKVTQQGINYHENHVLKLQFNRVSDGDQEIVSFPKELLTNDDFRTQLSGRQDDRPSITEDSPLNIQTLSYNSTQNSSIMVTFEQSIETNTSTGHSIQMPVTFSTESSAPECDILAESLPNNNNNNDEREVQSRASTLFGESPWTASHPNNDAGAIADESVDSDLTQIVEEMSIDEDFTNVDHDDDRDVEAFPSHNPTDCAVTQSLIEPIKGRLLMVERQESDCSVVENTPQCNLLERPEQPTGINDKKVKKNPREDHAYEHISSDAVIDESLAIDNGPIEHLNELCEDFALVNEEADNNCKSQSLSLLDIPPVKNVTDNSEIIYEGRSSTSAAADSENLMVIDGDLVQETTSEGDSELRFEKKQRLKADKIMEKREKYTDRWPNVPLEERVSQKFVDKFNIRILEDGVDSLLDVNYRPNFNNFYFPRLDQKESMVKLKEASDLAVRLSAVLDSNSVGASNGDDSVVMAANNNIEDDNNRAYEACALPSFIDTCPSSSENTPNRKWVKDYLNKAKMEMANRVSENFRSEAEPPFERFRWNDERINEEEEEEETERAPTKDELFEKMCRLLGKADWLDVDPDL